MTAADSTLLRRAAHLYRLCVRVAPPQFREQFGDEAEHDFQQMVADTLRRQGTARAVAAGLAICIDTVRIGLAERIATWRSMLLSGASSDLRQSLRIYAREPLLAAALALTLALVAGPSVAMFSALYQWVLAPLPYPEAQQLFLIGHRAKGELNTYLTAASVADYRGVESFAAVGGAFPFGPIVIIDKQPERFMSYRVTSGLLTELGVTFVAGRDMERGALEVVITRGLALSRFGSERTAVGRPITIDGRASIVVGVLAYRPPLPGQSSVDLFIPHDGADRPDPFRQGTNTMVIVRLKPARDVRVASEQTAAVAAAVKHDVPASPEATPELVPLADAISGRLRTPMLALSAAGAILFLLAITSLASLVLARSAGRSTDVAIRMSLGASRWQIVRKWLVDGIVLTVPGMVLAAWGGTLLMTYARSILEAGRLRVPELEASWPTFFAAIVLAVATAALFAAAPAAAGLLRERAVRPHSGDAVVGLRRPGLQSVVVVGQVALSVVLVTAAAWLSLSVWRTFSRPLGFEPSGLIVAQIASAQPPAAQTPLVPRKLERLRRLQAGDADSVAAVTALPGAAASWFEPARIRADQPPFPPSEAPTIARSLISRNYFRVMGIGLVEGREFSLEDERTPAAVIIVSRSFASRWFPDGALGRVVSLATKDQRQVIGIVEDVHAANLAEDSVPQAYLPLTNGRSLGGLPSVFVIRTSRSADLMRSGITDAVKEVDPTASVTVFSANEAIALPLRVRLASRTLVSALAGVALLLSLVNVYSLSALVVVQRTREIGIRMALGARAAEASRLIMRRGLAWVVAGLVLGAAGSLFVAAPLIRNQLFETRTDDPSMLLAVLLTVATTALVASWVPARRVARIDPAIVLRTE